MAMGIELVLTTQELVDAQAHVWNHMFNYINSMSLKCALQLSIPEIIHKHGKPMPLSELVHALSVHKAKSPALYRLMRILIHSKFFVKLKIDKQDDHEGYWLTPASRLLLRNDPFSVAPFALMVTDPFLIDPWHHIAEWFQNDDPTAYATAHGKELWEHVGQEPKLNKFFNEAMASDAVLLTGVLVKDCKHVFEGLKSMVDVAGGTGKVARIMADAFDGLKCCVLELPHVVHGLSGDNDKLSFIAGDMFKSVPPADAIFLKWILHDWNDEDCVKILKNCREAIRSKDNGGKVIIVDMIVDETQGEEAVETQLLFDMMMLMMVPGRERTENEWEKLFVDSGFTSYKITPVLGVRSLIEVYP